MTEDQKKLYNDWKALEDATRIDAQTPSVRGEYFSKPISLDDIGRLEPMRQKVWAELRDELGIAERFDLGKNLDKSLREIFAQYLPH